MASTHQLYRHAFTISDPDDQISVDGLKGAMRNVGGKKAAFCFQQERGSDAGVVHWQGRVKLEVKKRTLPVAKSIAAFLKIELPRVHVRPEHDEGAHSFYVMKDDTRLAGPFSDRKIYQGKDLECMKKPRPWQASVLNMVEQAPDDRTIHWIFDEAGNKGKSKLVKWLCMNKDAVFLPVNKTHQLNSAITEIGAKRLYLLDIPRTIGVTDSVRDMVSAIEGVKNGHVSTAMYGKHKVLYMEPPHVFCFANQECPHEMCSPDRWKTYIIDSAFGLIRQGAPPLHPPNPPAIDMGIRFALPDAGEEKDEKEEEPPRLVRVDAVLPQAKKRRHEEIIVSDSSSDGDDSDMMESGPEDEQAIPETQLVPPEGNRRFLSDEEVAFLEEMRAAGGAGGGAAGGGM